MTVSEMYSTMEGLYIEIEELNNLLQLSYSSTMNTGRTSCKA